ncbi:hypothetical protein CEXT_674931 [Caerostris extrusa]|uniref:Uncharacterized protein n=1 Tax=Caerostris extrusa TaxID=172846 RepID=A0AAV4P246_CAEEX|nr:hypothetical protein CEXT_674931 [Caerostris extrusa]
MILKQYNYQVFRGNERSYLKQDMKTIKTQLGVHLGNKKAIQKEDTKTIKSQLPGPSSPKMQGPVVGTEKIPGWMVHDFGTLSRLPSVMHSEYLPNLILIRSKGL